MQGLRTAWKEAAWVFGLSRLIILIVTYITVSVLPQAGQAAPPGCARGFKSCLLAWYHWDAAAYVRIAHQGYSLPSDVAFFPLWPLIEHFGGLLLGGSFPFACYIAGLLLSNIFFYFALVLLYSLLSEDFEPTVARRALFYFAFSPYALFFFAGYTESLFVLLCVAIFLLLRRGKALDWWLAGFLGFLAALTRSSGIVLAIPFFVVYIQRFWTPEERPQHSWLQKVNAFLPILLIPAGIAVYLLYLGYTKGSPLILSHQEATVWNRHFDFIWNTYFTAFRGFFTHPIFSWTAQENFLDISFTLIPLAALILGWKLIPLHYRLFALALALFSLSFPLAIAEPLNSQPRYLMVIFPIAVILAIWGKRQRFDQCFNVVSLPLLAVNIILFVSHYRVA